MVRAIVIHKIAISVSQHATSCWKKKRIDYPTKKTNGLIFFSLCNQMAQVWGPHAWITMHAMSAAYPNKPTEEQRRAGFNLISSITELLPCDRCKKHFRQVCKDFGFTSPSSKVLSSKYDFFGFLVEAHNIVNFRLGKPIMSHSWARERYEKMITPMTESAFSNYISLSLSGAILLACTLVLIDIRRKNE